MCTADKELTQVQIEAIRAVLERNHDYDVNHPIYPMPKACMWPDEVMGEIINALKHRPKAERVENST